MDPLEDKEFAYFHSMKLSGRIDRSTETPRFDQAAWDASSTNGSMEEEDDDTDEQQELELELPEHLSQDYSQFTVAILKQ